MLTALGVVDHNLSTVVRYETHEVQPCLPYNVDLLVYVEWMNKRIKHTLVDEGVVTSVMSLACWKGLGSPTLSKYMTMFTTFEGNSFWLHGIIPSLQV